MFAQQPNGNYYCLMLELLLVERTRNRWLFLALSGNFNPKVTPSYVGSSP
jgi:hypothetical protein